MNYLQRPHDPDDPMWVVGCIDSHGAITARIVTGYASVTHTVNESRGKRWRWNIWGQEFHGTRNPTLDHLTDEEWDIVANWLVKKKLAYPESV